MADPWARPGRRVANTVVDFEPVTMLVPPDVADEAARLLDPRVDRLACPLDDAWLRDSGPTFLLGPEGRLAAARWQFNAWGWPGDPPVQQDIAAGDAVAARAGAVTFASRLVNEGGAICVDGEGTVLATESVQLSDQPQPRLVEGRRRAGAVLDARLPARSSGSSPASPATCRATAPMVTSTCWRRSSHRASSSCTANPIPSTPDHAVMAENVGRLRGATDARGRHLELVELDAPVNRWEGGVPLDCSYVNFSFVNGGAVLCAFDDPAADDAAAATFAGLLPGRRLVPVPALDLFRYGGGVHCITQQQPAPRAPSPAEKRRP